MPAAASCIAAAHQVAGGDVPEVPLGELPLGAGHAWTVTERAAGPGHEEQNERRVALIPAWHAATELDLLARELGFSVAAEALIACCRQGPTTTGPSNRRSPPTTAKASRLAAITGLYVRTQRLLSAAARARPRGPLRAPLRRRRRHPR